MITVLSSQFSANILYCIFLSIAAVDGASLYNLGFCKASGVSGPMPQSGAIVRPSRALLMDMKWLDRILDGSKSWEVRGENTKIRETIGSSSALV